MHSFSFLFRTHDKEFNNRLFEFYEEFSLTRFILNIQV